MDYQVPNWFNNKKIAFERVTDEQLAAVEKQMKEMIANNRERHTWAVQTCQQMIQQAARIFGEKTDAYKDVRRAANKVPPPPDLQKAFVKFRQTVYAERDASAQRAKRREYGRAYRERRKNAERDYWWEYDDNVYPLPGAER